MRKLSSKMTGRGAPGSQWLRAQSMGHLPSQSERKKSILCVRVAWRIGWKINRQLAPSKLTTPDHAVLPHLCNTVYYYTSFFSKCWPKSLLPQKCRVILATTGDGALASISTPNLGSHLPLPVPTATLRAATAPRSTWKTWHRDKQNNWCRLSWEIFVKGQSIPMSSHVLGSDEFLD